jgi:putative oxidoreductase
MAIVRRVARPLLATIFVYGGLEALRNAESKVAGADKVVARLPPKLPVVGTTKQLVQADAAVKIVGGTLLATGRAPRVAALALAASLVPTTLAGHRFWEEKDPVKRKTQQLHFAKNASILGGVLLAAVDTHGKPSVAWRVRQASRLLRNNTSGKVVTVTSRGQGVAGSITDRVQDLLPT